VALHVTSQMPSTHDEPVALHCVPSEQRFARGVHVPSTHRSPVPPQSESALQGPVRLPTSKAASVASVPASTGGGDESTPASDPPLLVGTHWATLFESLHTYPSGQPFVLQSPEPASVVVDAWTHWFWSLHTYPESQSLSVLHCHVMHAPE
jgi:hypothetical protein